MSLSRLRPACCWGVEKTKKKSFGAFFSGHLQAPTCVTLSEMWSFPCNSQAAEAFTLAKEAALMNMLQNLKPIKFLHVQSSLLLQHNEIP